MARHRFACPVRWSDVDAFGHVNNVVYLTYLEEARVALLADTKTEAMLDTGIVVSRHEIDYRAPLLPRNGTVGIDTWIRRLGAASFTVGYEIFDGEGSDRITYAIASTDCVPYDFEGEHPRRVAESERAALSPYLETTTPTPSGRKGTVTGGLKYRYPFTVRWADLDKYNHVNNTVFAEYLQEARIHFMRSEVPAARRAHEGMVLAHQEIAYVRPLLYRPEPVIVSLRVSHLGRTSFVMDYEIHDEATVYARASSAQVAFDLAAQSPRPLSEAERDTLAGFMGEGGLR